VHLESKKSDYDVGSRGNVLPPFMPIPLLGAFCTPSGNFGHTCGSV
jgi:hypothetical protein